MVRITAGASRIKVKVPRDSGVKVKLSGALVKNNLKDLGWTFDNQSYISPGYDKAAKHLDIDLNMAVGNFELEEYIEFKKGAVPKGKKLGAVPF